MAEHKGVKWAEQIISCRNPDGMWGNFHALSEPGKNKSITTEQALRRLRILGYTKDDEVIKTALEKMTRCVAEDVRIDSYSEKSHDWALFEKLMLSAWIRLFDPENEATLSVARQWGEIAEAAFSGGRYSYDDDRKAFAITHGRLPRSGFESGFGMFYHAALLPRVVSAKTEDALLEYYISRSGGIYYIYEKPIYTLPEVFASKQTSRYLAAVEVLAMYPHAGEKLGFVRDWLLENRLADGRWDLGSGAKDGVYFPLSDSWRCAEYRTCDCTERISGLLEKL